MASRGVLEILNPVRAAQNLLLSQQITIPKSPTSGFHTSLLVPSISAPTVEDAERQILAIGQTQGLGVTLSPDEKRSSIFRDIVSGVSRVLSFTTPGGAASGIGTALSATLANDPVAINPRSLGIAELNPTEGGKSMAFQDGDSWSFGDIFSGVNQALQGGLGSQLLNIGGNALTSYINNLAPQPVAGFGGAVATPAMAAVPAIAGAGRAVATVGRGFFNRFPNLATSIQSLRNRGSNVSRSSLYSAMRRFGPELLVSGGIMTAAAVSELAVAGPGRRRMNPGNVKALRRAHRRLKSFHHLCVDNDQLMRRRRK